MCFLSFKQVHPFDKEDKKSVENWVGSLLLILAIWLSKFVGTFKVGVYYVIGGMVHYIKTVYN